MDPAQLLFGALQARNIVVGTPNFEVACQGLMTMLQLKLNQVLVVSRQERDDVLKELMASPLESRDRISLMDAVEAKISDNKINQHGKVRVPLDLLSRALSTIVGFDMRPNLETQAIYNIPYIGTP